MINSLSKIVRGELYEESIKHDTMLYGESINSALTATYFELTVNTSVSAINELIGECNRYVYSEAWVTGILTALKKFLGFFITLGKTIFNTIMKLLGYSKGGSGGVSTGGGITNVNINGDVIVNYYNSKIEDTAVAKVHKKEDIGELSYNEYIKMTYDGLETNTTLKDEVFKSLGEVKQPSLLVGNNVNISSLLIVKVANIMTAIKGVVTILEGSSQENIGREIKSVQENWKTIFDVDDMSIIHNSLNNIYNTEGQMPFVVDVPRNTLRYNSAFKTGSNNVKYSKITPASLVKESRLISELSKIRHQNHIAGNISTAKPIDWNIAARLVFEGNEEQSFIINDKVGKNFTMNIKNSISAGESIIGKLDKLKDIDKEGKEGVMLISEYAKIAISLMTVCFDIMGVMQTYVSSIISIEFTMYRCFMTAYIKRWVELNTAKR